MYAKSMDGTPGNYLKNTVNNPMLAVDGNTFLITGGTNDRLYETFTQYIGEIANI